MVDPSIVRVIHGTDDPHNGGAGRAAQRIAEAVGQVGVVPSMISSAERMTLGKFGERTLSRWQGSRPGSFRSSGLVPGHAARQIKGRDPDLVHLHWVGRGFLSSRQIGRIDVPVIWTLHDMWPFCATEHYADTSCDAGWRTGYRSPKTVSQGWSRLVWAAKKSAWRGNFTFVSPSRWLANLKEQSALLPDARVEVIPNPVPVETFHDADRIAARRELGIPGEGPVVGFVADEGHRNPLKGFDDLVQAFHLLHSAYRSVRLLLVGRTTPATPEILIPYLATGQLRDDRRLAAAYAACDVVCVPSLVDNAPQTAIEASATGRPVVAYASGGIPELVDDGTTGLLARTGDVQGLAHALATLIEKPSFAERLGRAGRARALREWNPTTIGERYRDLYLEILHTAGAAADRN